MKKALAITIIALMLPAVCVAQDHVPSTTRRIPRITRAPKLAEFLAGHGREDMAKIADFRQREPKDGAPASQATTAYVAYDDAQFYAVFVCKDQPSRVRAHLSRRDNIAGD